MYIRRSELRAIERAAGFVEKGGWETPVMWLLSAAVLIFALAMGLAVRKKNSPEAYRKAFQARRYGGFAVTALSGFAALAGAVLFVINRRDFSIDGVAMWVFAALAVGTGLAIVAMSLCQFTQKEGPGLLLWSVVPALFYCYWMVLIYRDNASNPTIEAYCFQCFAFAAAAVGFYYTAGFAYGRRKPGASVTVGILSVYLMIVTLADAYTAGLKLVIGGSALFMAMSLGRLLAGLAPAEGVSGGKSGDGDRAADGDGGGEPDGGENH